MSWLPLRSRSSLALSILALLLLACSPVIGRSINDGDELFDEDPESSDLQPRPDAGPSSPEADAGPSEPVDENLALCGIPSQVDDLGERSGVATKQTANGFDSYFLPLVIDSGPPEDVVWIELYEGFGSFENKPPQPGTYNLSGDNGLPATCGACVYLDADATATGAGHYLIARSGTLTISSINGVLAGSAQDLVFAEYDPETGNIMQGGCSNAIGALRYSGSF